MNKTSIKREVYSKPLVRVNVVFTESLLQSASGQHAHIGQNGGYGDAKKSFDWDIDEDDNVEYEN